MRIESDKQLNPKLQEEAANLRQGMVSQIAKEESERFSFIPSKDNPSVIIKDNTTNKEVEVPLFAAREVLSALNKLFD